MNAPQYEIKVLNVKEDIRTFQKLAPELKKELDKEIKGLLRPILVEAQSLYPSTDEVRPSGWRKGGFKKFSGIGPMTQEQTRGFVAYDGTRAKQGLKTITPKARKGASGFTGFYGIVQRDTGGAIFETAGRGSKASRARTRASRSRNPNASRDFIQTIEKYHGVVPTARHEGNDKGRALIKAFENNKGRIFVEVRSALRNTISRIQTQLDNNAKEV
jgi:hypothetical protein